MRYEAFFFFFAEPKQGLPMAVYGYQMKSTVHCKSHSERVSRDEREQLLFCPLLS